MKKYCFRTSSPGFVRCHSPQSGKKIGHFNLFNIWCRFRYEQDIHKNYFDTENRLRKSGHFCLQLRDFPLISPRLKFPRLENDSIQHSLSHSKLMVLTKSVCHDSLIRAEQFSRMAHAQMSKRENKIYLLTRATQLCNPKKLGLTKRAFGVIKHFEMELYSFLTLLGCRVILRRCAQIQNS